MNEIVNQPVKKIIWKNLIFFAVTTLLGVIGTPIYLSYHRLSLSETLLFAFFMIATPLSITLGYHRLFAHVTFRANAFVRFLVLFFGAAAFQQSALKWASQHREHHRYVDTDRDPYNIKKGFFYAHIGWLIFWKHHFNFDNVKDLNRNRLVVHQHKYYHLWAITAGIILPLLIGFLTGHPLGALLISVCLRLTIVYHGTFCINSVCHMFGRATYDIYSSARDHWVAALITCGEGYHNFHHHFPSDYRNGVRWYHWDPTKWTISILSFFGLASNLKRVSKFQIMWARITAENLRVQDMLGTIESHPHFSLIQKAFQTQYTLLRQTLGEWELAARKRQLLIGEGLVKRSDELKQALVQIEEAKQKFRQMLTHWKSYCSRVPATV